MRASVELFEVELSLFAHDRHILVVLEEFNEFASLFFSFSSQGLRFALICTQQLRLNLLLQVLTPDFDVGFEEEEQEVGIQEGCELLDLLERVHFFRFSVSQIRVFFL